PATEPGLLTIDDVTPLSSVQGDDVDLALVAHGGRGSVTWSVSSGQLPPGLALAGTSQRTVHVIGRPLKVGAFRFEAGIVDSQGQRASRTVEVAVASSLAIEGGPLPDATEDVPYHQELSAVRGSGPAYHWRISAGALPPGVSLSGLDSPTLMLDGTPGPGRFAFTFTVADADGNERSHEVALWVHSALAIDGEPQRSLVGEPFDLALHVRGGIGPYDWHVVAGEIPGLALTADGADAHLRGTPTVPGTTSLAIEATDHNGGRLARTLDSDLRARLQITTDSLSSAQHGVAYSTGITGSGGLDNDYRWEVIAGALPD